jgi:hypothetical protein
MGQSVKKRMAKKGQSEKEDQDRVARTGQQRHNAVIIMTMWGVTTLSIKGTLTG